jgi:serine/threonine protein kinase/lipoprotein NlpI
MRNLSANDLDALLDRQKAAWIAGERPRVEDLLTGSSFPNQPEAFLDLLYNEIVLREELGECPSVDEYVENYPQLADDLQLHFEIHAALQKDDLLNDTRLVRPDDAEGALDSTAMNAMATLRDYDVLAPLGRGGMGVVYRARHRRLNRPVALKMFQPGRLPSPRELDRFHVEAQAIARLQHPNIVQIFEVGQSRGLPFLALELAEGGTLAERLRDLPFKPIAAAELVRSLAGAIHHAHEQRIIHRDLKPANVLFAKDGTPKITDFGLAKMLEEPADGPHDATRTGEPMGTPRYMSPEQAAGRPDQIGPSTDVYALGTLLYECLTGQVPFMAASVVTTMEKIRNETPVSPRRHQSTIPRDLATICLKCLQKEPGRRYPSAQALADDLGRFLRHEPIHARPTPSWQRVRMWSRRRPARAVLLAVALLAAVAGIAWFGVQQQLERQRINKLRDDVSRLVGEGQQALARNDNQGAQERFLSALALVRSEPALQDSALGVLGWIDHGYRLANQERWSQRRPPPLFDELRDEAVVLCLLLDPSQPRSIADARQAIQAALALAVPTDPAWRSERERLALLDADLLLREGNAEAALVLLDQAGGIESRLRQNRRADCLERLGRKAEAESARQRADELAPRDTLAFFLSGIDRLQRHDLAGAAADFDQVLMLEPDHFMARLCQGDCFLRQNRLGEARVALTACLGQRPRFAWTYLLRGQMFHQSHDDADALGDFQHGLDLKPREAARFSLLVSRGFLRVHIERWTEARSDFDNALALQPDAPAARIGRGLTSVAQGNHRDAIAEVQPLVSLSRPELLVSRARLFAQAAVLVESDRTEGRREEKKAAFERQAVADLRQALDQQPESDRRAFWSRTVGPERGLRTLENHPGFRQLVEQWRQD